MEYAVERQELLTSNTDGYRRELDAIRQKNNQQILAMTKLQMQLDNAEQVSWVRGAPLQTVSLLCTVTVVLISCGSHMHFTAPPLFALFVFFVIISS